MAESEERNFWIGLARAFAGALLFSFPLLMTMEMWWMGFYLSPLKLILFTVILIPTLFGIAHFAGFQPTSRWFDDLCEALVAYSVGFLASAFFLSLIAVLWPEMTLREIFGKVILLAVPASIGAILASQELGEKAQSNEDRKEEAGYWGELFMMAVGALFFGFSVAPTIEMLLIGIEMTPWHSVVMVVVSLVMMHAIVYAVGFSGQEQGPEGTNEWGLFMRFTTVGYGAALLISAYLLWTFGRFDGLAPLHVVQSTVVLALPASLGAAVSRIVL